MTADIIKIYSRALAPDHDVANDLADLLDGGRCDPSDDESCMAHLLSFAQFRPKVVADNFEAAMYEYGQRRIARAIAYQQAAE